MGDPVESDGFSDMNGDLQRAVGHIEGRLGAVEEDVREIKDATRRIEGYVSQAKGGWKALVVVGSIGGVAGGVLAKIMPFLPFR